MLELEGSNKGSFSTEGNVQGDGDMILNGPGPISGVRSRIVGATR